MLETPEKITRIADYEADVEEIELKPQQVSSRLDKSREKGSSRILLRRSHNRSSHKERSEGSEISVEKRSVSSKRVKENSIFKRGPIELASGKKVSEIEEQLLREDKVKVNQTIEINGYDINDRASSDKKTPKLKETNKMANFKDGAADISSIESNSVLRLFHHSAEKILNISAQEQSDLNESRPFTKEGAREVVEHVTKPIATPPLVGDYYQEEANIKSDVELTPKKQSAKELSKSRADEQTSKKDYQLNKEKE